jgi:hypothetical protein
VSRGHPEETQAVLGALVTLDNFNRLAELAFALKQPTEDSSTTTGDLCTSRTLLPITLKRRNDPAAV